MWRSIGRIIVGQVLVSVSVPLLAQAPRSGGGESQQIVSQYQALAAEKTALQSQVDTLKHDLDAARAELATVKKDRDALKSHSTAVGASIAELTVGKQTAEKNADQTKQQLNQLVTRFRETATELKQIETDRDRLQGSLRERSAAFDQCAADNLSLFEINADLLNRYQHVGLFTRATAGEPFARITRNRIDNLVDEYRARALELRAKNDAAVDSNKSGGKPVSAP